MRLATDSAARSVAVADAALRQAIVAAVDEHGADEPRDRRASQPRSAPCAARFPARTCARRRRFLQALPNLARERPLGENPLLVSRIQPRRDQQGRHVLGLLPTVGQGVHLTLDENLLHGLVKLIQSAAARADWDLELEVPAGMAPAMSEESGRPTIN